MFVCSVGNCVVIWVYDAQKYGTGVEDQIQDMVVIKTKIFPSSRNSAYYAKKLSCPCIGQ